MTTETTKDETQETPTEKPTETNEKKEDTIEKKEDGDDLGGLDEDDDKLSGDITLCAKDGSEETISKEAIARLSGCVRKMLAGDKEATKATIQVPSKTTLSNVIKYTKHHHDTRNQDERIYVKKPVKTTDIKEVSGGNTKEMVDTSGKISQWDATFITEIWEDKSLNVKSDKLESGSFTIDGKAVDIEHQALWELIAAANYLDMPHLVHLGCAMAATKVKGQKNDAVVKILGLNPEDKQVKAVLSDQDDEKQD